MIGRKLFLIGEEAGLPFILIGRNRFDHCLKDIAYLHAVKDK
jgi:hypothetical protein